MPRGKKKFNSLEEQLEKVTNDIAIKEESLKRLKDLKKSIEEQIRLNHLTELDKLISESGKSLEEIKNILAS